MPVWVYTVGFEEVPEKIKTVLYQHLNPGFVACNHTARSSIWSLPVCLCIDFVCTWPASVVIPWKTCLPSVSDSRLPDPVLATLWTLKGSSFARSANLFSSWIIWLDVHEEQLFRLVQGSWICTKCMPIQNMNEKKCLTAKKRLLHRHTHSLSSRLKLFKEW